MSNLKYILVNMILLGVFVFSIMTFIITIQIDGNVTSEYRITNNTLINDSYGYLEANLSQQNNAEQSLNNLEDVPPTEYVGDLDVASTVSATRLARSMIVGLWNIYVKLPIVILGVSPIVASAITTLLLILIAIAIWALWKGVIS